MSVADDPPPSRSQGSEGSAPSAQRRLEPRRFLDGDGYAQPYVGHGLKWRIPAGDKPQDLYAAVLQHIVCAAFNDMLDRQDEDPAHGYRPAYDEMEMKERADARPGKLDIWYQDREARQGYVEMDKLALSRVLDGRRPLSLNQMGWMMVELEPQLRPDGEKIFIQLHLARDALEAGRIPTGVDPDGDAESEAE